VEQLTTYVRSFRRPALDAANVALEQRSSPYFPLGWASCLADPADLDALANIRRAAEL